MDTDSQTVVVDTRNLITSSKQHLFSFYFFCVIHFKFIAFIRDLLPWSLSTTILTIFARFCYFILFWFAFNFLNFHKMRFVFDLHLILPCLNRIARQHNRRWCVEWRLRKRTACQNHWKWKYCTLHGQNGCFYLLVLNSFDSYRTVISWDSLDQRLASFWK